VRSKGFKWVLKLQNNSENFSKIWLEVTGKSWTCVVLVVLVKE